MGVRLTWTDNNYGEDGHNIYRSTSPMDPENLPTELDSVDANVTVYDDGSVVEGTTYYYRVSATMAGAEMVSDEIEVLLEETVDIVVGTMSLISNSDVSTLDGLDNTASGINAKPHNVRSWWNAAQNRFDGIVYKDDSGSSASDAYIVTDLHGSPSFTSVEVATRNTERVDARFVGDRVHVFRFYSGASGDSRYTGVDYNSSTDTYSIATENNINVSGMTTDTGASGAVGDTRRPGGMCVDSLGQIWATVFRTSGLMVTRSTDDGATWSTVVELGSYTGPGIATITPFEHSGTEYVCIIAVADGAAGGARYSWVIDVASGAITSGNWTNESSNMPGFIGDETGDDHLCVRAFNNTLFAATKNEGGSSGDPQQSLLVRTAAGVWSHYTALEYGADVNDDLPTRPCIAILETTEQLIYLIQDTAGAGSPPTGRGTGNCYMKTAELSNLSALKGSSEVLVFDNASDQDFVNMHTPAEPAGSEGVLVLVTSHADKTQYTNLIIED